MLSTKYNQATSSNDRAAPLKSKIHKLTRVAKSHAEMSARASDDDDGTSAHSKNNAASQRRSTTELDQWHKLMGDYERLQLVASTKAHNKLIRSSSESSLGSSSNLSQASTVVASSNSSSTANNTTNQRPTSMIARLSSAARATANTRRQTSDEQEMRENYAHESEIGQCLSELVESVVAAAVATRATSERAQVTYEQERERERPQPFRSFKLHEAILAKTQSSSSDNASSCDEATAQDKPGPCARKRVVRVNALGEFALGEQEAHDREHVIYAAREFACAHPAGDQLTVGSSDSTIKWLDANNNEGQLGMGQILGCQQDDELIVWLLHVGTQDVASPTSDVGLDLDDIAMALNEPVSSKQQQIRALIWSCANSADARQLVDFWVNHTQNVAHKQQQQENHQIEVKPCEVAAAEQMKSSGLFVLQQQPPVECTESRGQTTKQPTEVVRLAKAASTLDLATSGSSSSLARQPALRRPTEGANLLANYYRSVTNKMMGGSGHSSGSTSGRLKNFTQEMSKLNGRGQTTLAKSARRLSMALNQFSHSTSSSSTSGAAQLQQTQTKSSTATDDVALPPPPPAVKPRTSVLKSSLAPEQRALPRSILKRQCTSGSDERVDGSGAESSRVEQLERVKQRASCHDLAKVLGPNDMASDKDKPTLRANWTNSVASRSRQRRPALLLNDQVEASANTESSAVAESGAGMVRAKASMSHLRRSASMKVLAVASSDAREEKLVDDDQREQLQEASANSGQRELPVVGARKRSEFDPRSLRKLSNSEAAQALREGADYEASYEAERKLRREKARRRRSMANLGELRGELDADAQQQVVVAREEPSALASAPSSFSKGFSLLRQSFRQKNFSSMLGLSNGARSATAPHMTTNDEQVESDVSLKLETNAQIKQKLEAIKMAEANLLAAKQLKQQAQRLREQQKRNEQQLQIHKQQQQQQLIYQQHYAQQSNRSHTQQQLMFDPVHFHQQQQQFYQAQQFQMYQQRQQQQQQQLAYLSSSHSAAHFMAAAAAAAQPAMTLAPQLGGVGNHYGPAYGAPPQAMMPFVPNHHLQPPVAAQAPINHSARLAAANRYLYPQQPAAHLMGPADNMQQAHQHQFIPMSVNHHSSFNIVYTATSGAGHHSLPANCQPHYVTQQPYPTAPVPLALPMPSTMTVAQMPEQPRFGLEHAIEMQQQPAIRSKHSSLGASVRKTMRSVLSSGAGKSTKIVAPNTPVADAPAQSKPGKPLKSALKSSASDGSDDASPASTSSSSSPSSSSSSSPLSSSSDSSLASSGSTQNSTRPARTNSKSATLTKRELERLRKEFIVNSGGGKQTCSQTLTASELAAAAAAAQTRKNVTFSTKLTSIL